MKIRTEICESADEEIIIRCRERTEQIERIEALLGSLIKRRRELVLSAAGAEHYVAVSEILFFESCDGKVYAHTRDGLFTTEHKLFELSELLPDSFVRISKSAIANVYQIRSLRRELVGNGELTFKGSGKKVYFSRSYYKDLKQKLEEMRSII